MPKTRKPFEFKNFTVFQENVSLPVTTDACIFGAIVDFDNPQNILDMGSGTGLLMLMQHQKYPQAIIKGIDLHPESVDTSNRNFQFNHVNHLLSAEVQNWWHYKPEILFDGIVCNPPFFENHLPSQNPLKKQARHTNGYALKTLVSLVSNWLSNEGSFYMLAPYTTIENIQNEWDVSSSDLHLNQQISIRSFRQSNPHLNVLKFSRNKYINSLTNDIVVYESASVFTESTRNLLTPFLLDRALK